MNRKSIGFFDSGIGGISVLNECMKLMPNEDYIYLSDSAFAPYGNKTESEILERVNSCAKKLLMEGCKAVVIACNTATGVGVSQLRSKFNCPFVGLEPALKPACENLNCESVLLLCTYATSKQAKLKNLLAKYSDKNIVVAPQSELAFLIENNIENLSKIRAIVENILSQYKDCNAIVLGCTHYVFIKKMISEIVGKDVRIYDGNEGAAKRLKFILESENLLSDSLTCGSAIFI